MKYLLIVLGVLVSNFSLAASIEGRWYSYNEESGEVESEITLQLINGKLEGFISDVFGEVASRENICNRCEGERKGKPILNLRIMWGYTCVESKCHGGVILDPKTGKQYSSNLTLVDERTLRVLGYIGSSFFGKTRVWLRPL